MNSKAYQKDPEGVLSLWHAVSSSVYSLSQKESQLGLGDDGITCYFSANCTKHDAQLVKEFMVAKVSFWHFQEFDW